MGLYVTRSTHTDVVYFPPDGAGIAASTNRKYSVFSRAKFRQVRVFKQLSSSRESDGGATGGGGYLESLVKSIAVERPL